MTDVNYLVHSRYIAGLCEQAKFFGIELELRSDFGYLVRLCETLPNNPDPTTMFNPLHHHIGPENGFWIKGTTDDGEVAHVQAVRFDDLSGTNLAQEYENLRAFYFDPAVSAEEAEVCQSFAPIAKKITGRTCYHGENWLRPGTNGLRGRGLSRILPKIAMSLALIKWNPDYLFCFGYETLINNGVILQSGYNHFQPNVVRWHRPSHAEPLDVWLAWMERQDLVDMPIIDEKRDVQILSEIRQTHEDRAAIVPSAAE